MPNLPRRALIVPEMQRRGTSAVAGTAVRLGFSGPRTPLPASANNPDGVTEPAPVVEANHRLLQAAGCAWNLCLTLDPERVGRMLGREDQLRSLQTLHGQFGHAGAFVLKDPRLCVTLPAWLPALSAMGARPTMLLLLRHPAEVVRSLAVRNRLDAADTAPNWLHHMLEAERMSRSFDRAVVQYDDPPRDWRSCMDEAGRIAGIAWPRPVEQAAADIGRFLQGSRRHRCGTGHRTGSGARVDRRRLDRSAPAVR